MASQMEGPDWYVANSDEEVYEEAGQVHGALSDHWRPPSQEVVALYERIEREGVLPLRWVCPGRRPPTPNHDEYETDEEEEEDTQASGATPSTMDKGGGDFDFDLDDSSATPSLTPRRPLGQRELKGSARKKTTSFNNVLSNMKRHRQMDAANRVAAAAAAQQPPTTPTSGAEGTPGGP